MEESSNTFNDSKNNLVSEETGKENRFHLVEILQNNSRQPEEVTLENLYNKFENIKKEPDSTYNENPKSETELSNFHKLEIAKLKLRQQHELEKDLESLNQEGTSKKLFLAVFRLIMTNVNKLRVERLISPTRKENLPPDGSTKPYVIEMPQELNQKLEKINQKINDLEKSRYKENRTLKCLATICPVLTVLMVAILIAGNEAIKRYDLI
jgi:hypothetical protein